MKLLAYISLSVVFLTISSKALAQAADTVCASAIARVYKVMPTAGSTYYWTVDNGRIISPNPYADSIAVVWNNLPGTYQVHVVERNKAGCLGDTVSATVVVNPKMHLDIFGPAQLCVGQPVWLSASGASAYKWSTGETTSNIFVHLQDTVATYQVIGTNVCETDTAAWTIKVHPRPTASFTYTPHNPIVDEPIYLHYNGKGATDWTWYINDQQIVNNNAIDPETSFNKKGYNSIKLVAINEYGCTDTLTDVLHISYDSKIYVPNAFTPDGDGVNDSFKAVGFNLKSIHMMIFNRWGEKIYESFGLNDAWDGTFKGQMVAQDVYIYMIDAEATDEQHYYLNGNVTVMY